MARVVASFVFFGCFLAVHFLSEQQVLCAKGLTRNLEVELSYANFVEHLFHYLNVSQVGSGLVNQLGDCAEGCLRVVTCFSFNVAAYPDVDGRLYCEFLASDKYNSSDKFQPSHVFHHYSIYNPCSEMPCANGGTCIALYFHDDFKCECPLGFKGKKCQTPAAMKNCLEVLNAGKTESGVYTIDPDEQGEFQVYCEQNLEGGGFAVFQRRLDGSVDFYRDWDEYKNGFGNLDGEFWLGLDKIHRLTTSDTNKLVVTLKDWNGTDADAVYDGFKVDGEDSNYKMTFTSFTRGSAGDSLTEHDGMPFSTKDRDNDPRDYSCSQTYKGAWWYNAPCHKSNLNGLYHPGGNHASKADGINWYSWKGNRYSAKESRMMIRPL